MFPYTLIRAKRKTVAVSINEAGEVIVKAPPYVSKREIERFLEQKSDWIAVRRKQNADRRIFTEREIVFYREKAKEVFGERIHYYEPVIGVRMNQLFIKDQKTRWGSCSSIGNINLNWRLVLAPKEVMDYVIIHELCHLKEMNHSKRFWDLVESVCPNYREQKKWLRENAAELGR